MAGSNRKSTNETTYSSNHIRNNKIQTSGRGAAYTYLALAIFFIFLSFTVIIRLSGANEPHPSSDILSAGEGYTHKQYLVIEVKRGNSHLTETLTKRVNEESNQYKMIHVYNEYQSAHNDNVINDTIKNMNKTKTTKKVEGG